MLRSIEERVVDNRVFLLGLDQHYREAMKLFEVTTLLPCAATLVKRLKLAPASIPVEGYYDDPLVPELSQYFLLMRTLQGTKEAEAAAALDTPELARLREISGSALFGEASYGEPETPRMLLPRGSDPLTRALKQDAGNWSVGVLAARAYELAMRHDDFSLVGLAARARDAVVMAALRESVVLHAGTHIVIGAKPKISYVWRVDAELAAAANRFIDLFNRLVVLTNRRSVSQPDPRLGFRSNVVVPRAIPESARHFWDCHDDNDIFGRCAALGRIDSGAYYHWAVRAREGGDELEVHDFLSPELWTTTRYRAGVSRPVKNTGLGGLKIV